MELTAERLRCLLDYDPATGHFTRKVGRQGAGQGERAGCLRFGGYIQIGIDGRKYRAHRLAWLYVTGEWPKGEIDHINGDPADNRILNLRDVPNIVNQQNRSRPMKRNVTGFLGVSAWKGRYKAAIHAAGRDRHLGTFDTPEEAHAAYVGAKRVLHEGSTLSRESNL